MHKYTNGDWSITILHNGTKIRTSTSNNPITLFPESMDVKINSWCDAGCAYCHEDSTKKGIKSPNLDAIINLYSQLPAGVEIAIGGGHPLAHEQFEEFVQELSNQGKICNVTINEFHFEKEKTKLEKLISKNYIKGVGYSYNKIPLNWDYEHAVTHVITGTTNFNTLQEIVKNNSGKVLFLGYKNFRRGAKYLDKHNQEIENNIQSWYRNLFKAASIAKLSFDNLAINQLNPQRLFKNPNNYIERFMGEDGTHTMYLDAVLNQAARTSTSIERFQLTSDIIQLFNLVKVHQ